VPVADPAVVDLVTAMRETPGSLDSARQAVAFLDAELAGDEELVTAVSRLSVDLGP
jgi:hypothetical protein